MFNLLANSKKEIPNFEIARNKKRYCSFFGKIALFGYFTSIGSAIVPLSRKIR